MPVLSRRFWRFQVVIWLAGASARLALADGLAGQLAGPRALQVLLWSLAWAAVGLLVSTSLAAAIERLPDRFLRGRRLAIVMLVSSLAGALAWALAMEGAGAIGGRPWMGPARPELPWAQLDILVLRGGLLFSAWTGLFLAFVLASRFAETRERTLRADALLQASRLELLRQQLNPHFLFNALNSIVALVDEDPARAQEMTRVLARMLRQTLTPAAGLVPLREEIDFLRLYLAFERVRFEESLQVRFDVPEAEQASPVIPFLLQPLVENAVKHGRNGEQVLTVVLRARRENGRLVLSVSNTGQLSAPPPTVGERPGIGLRSVRDRLAAAFPRSHQFALAESGGRVTARVEYDPDEGSTP